MIIHSAGNAAVAQQYNTNEREYMINWSKQDVKLLLIRVYMYILRVVEKRDTTTLLILRQYHE